MRRGKWPVLVAIAALGVAACGRGEAEEPAEAASVGAHKHAAPSPGTLPPGVSKEAGAMGRELYVKACVACHGEQAEGTQLGTSLRDDDWGMAGSGGFEDIIRVVRDGSPVTEPEHRPGEETQTLMPPRGEGTFTDEQVRAVSAYVFSLRGAK